MTSLICKVGHPARGRTLPTPEVAALLRLLANRLTS